MPPPDETLRMHGFDVLVLCAVELQLRSELFAGLTVLRCPLDDDYQREITHGERRNAFDTAAQVTMALRSGARVYVSCHMGRNRSGLVTALAVRDMTGCSGREAKQWIQSRRLYALTNPKFCELLNRLPRPDCARRVG